jgi:branched-subunit amino acid transport protein
MQSSEIFMFVMLFSISLFAELQFTCRMHCFAITQPEHPSTSSNVLSFRRYVALFALFIPAKCDQVSLYQLIKVIGKEASAQL